MNNDKLSMDIALEDVLEMYLKQWDSRDAAEACGASNIEILVEEILERLWPEEDENEDE